MTDEGKSLESNDTRPLYILQKIEDMIVYSAPIMEKWSVREMRSIGNRIFDCMNDMSEYATSIRSGFFKKTDLSALDKRNHHLQTHIKVAYKTHALKGLSSYKEWTRRSEEIGSMIGGFIKSVYDAESSDGNKVVQKQKSSGNKSGYYKAKRYS